MFTEFMLGDGSFWFKNCKEKSDNPKGKFGLKKMPKILCILIENKKDYKVSLKLEEKLNIEKYVN